MLHRNRTIKALNDSETIAPLPVVKNCRRCENYSQCQRLCPEAEAFVSQDSFMFPGWFSLWGDAGSAKSQSEVLGLKEMETDFAPVTGNRRPHSKLSEQEWSLLDGAGLSPRQKETLFLFTGRPIPPGRWRIFWGCTTRPWTRFYGGPKIVCEDTL